MLRFVGLPAPGTPETKTLSQRYDVKLPSDRSLMLARASAEERVQLHLEVRCQIHQLDTAEPSGAMKPVDWQALQKILADVNPAELTTADFRPVFCLMRALLQHQRRDPLSFRPEEAEAAEAAAVKPAPPAAPEWRPAPTVPADDAKEPVSPWRVKIVQPPTEDGKEPEPEVGFLVSAMAGRAEQYKAERDATQLKLTSSSARSGTRRTRPSSSRSSVKRGVRSALLSSRWRRRSVGWPRWRGRRRRTTRATSRRS